MKRIIVLGTFLLPSLVYAQAYDVSSIEGAVEALRQLLNLIFPVIVALAVFWVIWTIFKFIVNAGDEEARKSGRSGILWGIVGVFLMLSIWGLVNILVETFTLNNTPVTTPELLPEL